MPVNATEIQKGTYVVADYENKPSLIRVLSFKNDVIRGKWEIRDQEIDVEVGLDQVKAVLGPDPEIGNVYGCKTERLIHVHDKVGPFDVVEWYFNAQEDTIEQVHKNLLSGARKLKHHGLHHILRSCKVKVVLLTAKKKVTGRVAIGSYQCKAASVDNPDIITVKYHPDVLSEGPRLLCHEAGHGIWVRLMSPRLRARWVRMFLTRGEVEHTTAEDVAAALKLAVAEKSLLLSDQELQPALDLIVSQACSAASIRRSDLSLLLQEDIQAAKALLSPWREYPAYISADVQTLVTDYAATNPEEYFCESLANHCCGIATPEYLIELLEETLAATAGRKVHLFDD